MTRRDPTYDLDSASYWANSLGDGVSPCSGHLKWKMCRTLRQCSDIALILLLAVFSFYFVCLMKKPLFLDLYQIVDHNLYLSYLVLTTQDKLTTKHLTYFTTEVHYCTEVLMCNKHWQCDLQMSLIDHY